MTINTSQREMSKGRILSNEIYLSSDNAFNELYPLRIQRLAKRHWTPLHIAQRAANFLASKNATILDIGSGVGKFCLAAACYAPEANFYGIEQREDLIQHAKNAQQGLHLKNASFIHGNFTNLNLREFDHFYFFNSFYENINDVERIDENIQYSDSLYEYYVRYLCSGLQQMPKGTKVATYHSFHGEIPVGYEMVESYQSGELNFWIKK